LISLDTGRVLHPVRELPDGTSVRSATLTTDGRYLLLTDTTADFRPRHRWLWDVQDERFVCSQAESAPSATSDEPLPEQPEEKQRPFHFERSIRPDGQILVTHSPSGFSYTPDGLRAIVRNWTDTGSAWDETRLWDIASGELLATLGELDAERRPFHFSPDGKRFLRGIGSRIPQIRETATGEVVLQFEAHPESITALAYSPDGDTVMSGSKDGSLRLWHVASGRLLRDGVLMKGPVGSIAYSPDARRVLVATGGNGAFLFDLRSGKLIRRVGEPRTANSWERRASAAFSPDGRRILTQWQGVTWDSFKASLWDAETGNLLRDLCEIRVARGRRDLNPITISPDGRWGISAGGYLREPYRELAGRSG
jgi:WD40 repeat protein